MSLSTQLTRGTLALPMLALFGALALAAHQAADAETFSPAPVIEAATTTANVATLGDSQRRLLILRVAEASACGTRPTLMLAPADLGPIARRQGGACRTPAAS